MMQTFKDQLPFLLVLSPVIGFLVTSVAARAERDLVRHLAISNVFCSILLLAGAFGLYQIELRDDSETRKTLTAEAVASGAGKNVIEIVNSQMDRRHVDRQSQLWLVVDGVNLWPIFLLIVISGIVCWQSEVTSIDENWFFPNVLLFEAAVLTALMSCDLRVFLFALGTSILAMATMLGLWGGPSRRELTPRFLIAQFCGGACVMLGFVMLVVAVPWMKIEDSRTIPRISWQIAMITFEIQKWTSGNPLAFQYQNEVFPWILLVLSTGFAIQFGVFPFHSWLIELLSRVPASIALLFVSGLSSLCGTAWLRFVMPLSPELMVAFDWLILVPALGSAIWGSVRALVPASPRRRLAYLFLSMTGLSLLGCFSFSRVALSGMWLMQQQLIMTFCAAVTVLSSFRLSQWSPLGILDRVGRPGHIELGGSRDRDQLFDSKTRQCGPTVRSLLLMTCLPLVGFFASGCMILVEILRESLLLPVGMLIVCGLIVLSVKSLLANYASEMLLNDASAVPRFRIPLVGLVVLPMAVVANIFPQQILASIEPDFIRVFQKYEPHPEVTAEDLHGQ